MLKRTTTLVGLTIAASLVASLLLAGCGGHNSTVPSVENNPTSRFWGGRSNGSVTFISSGSPAVVEVYDPDGLWTITVQACPDSLGIRFTLVAGTHFPNGATSVRVTLPKFGEALYHAVSLVNKKWGRGSWKINPDGSVVRLW